MVARADLSHSIGLRIQGAGDPNSVAVNVLLETEIVDLHHKRLILIGCVPVKSRQRYDWGANPTKIHL
jgi:hypothetical protein